MLSIDAKTGSSAADAGAVAAYPDDVANLESYYSGDEAEAAQVPSAWVGRGAAALGLNGAVDRADSIQLLQGRDPSGQQLTKRMPPRPIRAKHADVENWLAKHHQTDLQHATAIQIATAHAKLDKPSQEKYGWDLTFSAPKSVSVLAAIDPSAKAGIEAAHDGAVRDALDQIEQRWLIAERGNHSAGEREIENVQMVAAVYRHDTSRDLDPQLHSHSLVMNTARRADGSWGAIQSHEIFSNQKTIGALYRSELAARLQDAGYAIERDETSFKIAGTPPQVEKAFSHRKEAIETYLKDHYQIDSLRHASATQIKAAVLATRPDKQQVDQSTLAADWRERAAELGLTVEQAAALRQDQPRREQIDPPAWRESVKASLFAHESVVYERDIWQAAAVEAQGVFRAREVAGQVEQIKSELKHIVSLDGAREAWTTPQFFATERDIIASAGRRLAEHSSQLAPATLDRAFSQFEAERGFALSAEQKAFCRSLSQEAGGVRIGTGHAGATKSTCADVVRIGYQAEGYHIVGLALAGTAAAELHTSARIQDTSTIHRFLLELQPREIRAADGILEKVLPAQRQLTDRDVLIVDEAGMVDSRIMGDLLGRAEKAHARVIMIGDVAQLQAVGPGGVFRHMTQQAQAAGQLPTLTEVRRQKEQWQKVAAEQVRAGDVAQALQSYFDRDALHIAQDKASAYTTTIDQWGSHYDRQRPGESLMLAGTLADAAKLNDLARAKMRDAHQLANETSYQVRTREGQAAGKLALAEGDRIRFTKNDSRAVTNAQTGAADQVRNGERATIHTISFDRSGNLIVTAQRDDKTMLRWKEADYGQIAHGYASTTNAAQGGTVDHVAVMVSGALNREKTYVEMSRQRIDCKVIITQRQIKNMADQQDQAFDPDRPLESLKSTIDQMSRSRPKETTLEFREHPDQAKPAAQETPAPAPAPPESAPSPSRPSAGEPAPRSAPEPPPPPPPPPKPDHTHTQEDELILKQ